MSFYGNSRNLDYNLIVEKDKENDDGYLSYSFYQGLEANEETFIGKIDIPLDKILNKVELEEVDNTTYLVFYFQNDEQTFDPIKLDVTKLNEYNGVQESATITLKIGEQSKNLSAELKDGSISQSHIGIGKFTEDILQSWQRARIKALANLTKNESPIKITETLIRNNNDLESEKNSQFHFTIADKSITKDYLADDVMTAINNSVVFNYENGRLKISYANKQEENK